MRWFAGISLIVGGLAAALAGVGFVLPTRLEVTAEETIERPRSTVYALISDAAGLSEILPVRGLDPGAEIAAEGDGVGLVLRWRSAAPAIGAGELEILELKAQEQATFVVRGEGAPPARSMIEITPIGDSAAVDVTWRFVSQCGAALQDLPCRYTNLFQRRRIQDDLASGLARLRQLAEAAPAADFESLDVARVTAPGGDYAFVATAGGVRPGAEQDAVAAGYLKVRAFLAKHALEAAGPVIVTPIEGGGGEGAFRVGVPFSGPAPMADIEVRVARLPEGPAVKATHSGPYDTRGDTHAKLAAYIAARRLRAVGPGWETFKTPPSDPAAIGDVEVWRRIEE